MLREAPGQGDAGWVEPARRSTLAGRSGPTIPLVVPQSIHSLVTFCANAGGSLGPLDIPRLHSGPVPLAYAGRLFEQLAGEVGDEGIGLRVAGALRFEDAPLGGLVRDSPTVGAALARAARASARYCGGQHIWLGEHGDDVGLYRRHSDALRRGRRQANDFALQMLIDLLRRSAGPDWRPGELHLEGPPPGHAEELAALSVHATHFGAAADCLVFPASVLALPLPPAPRPVGPQSPSLPDVDFVGSVRQTIQCLLELGSLNLESVAEAAGTSARSVQRRLAASGCSFGQLVDEVRFETACRLLRDPAVRITDVSIRLGYTDAANFTRAFRRWAGVAPRAFRRATPVGVG